METKVARLGWGVGRTLGIIYVLSGAFWLLLGLWLRRLTGFLVCVLGVILFIAGTVLLVREMLKSWRRNRLLAGGKYVNARVVDLYHSRLLRLHSRHPYRVVACYVDSAGRNHWFESQYFFFYGPQNLLDKPVRVYTDKKMRHYYVDVGPLLAKYAEQNIS